MKITNLINALEKLKDLHGEIDVMFQDSNTDGGPYDVGFANFHEAEEDEFPEDFNMPAGFKFIRLTD